MASIIPIGGKWRAQVRRKGHKPMTKTFPKKADAEAWARRIESGMDAGQPAVIADEMTVEQLVGHYRTMRAELGRAVAPVSNTRRKNPGVVPQM